MTPTFKILFLDCDGVLNSQQTFSRQYGESDPIDPEMIDRVRRIIAETGCKIVLSSTWRMNDKATRKVNSFIPIMGKTPYIPKLGGSEACERGYEIKSWLNRQALKSDFVVSNYAILDDSNDMLDSQQPNFFKTDWMIGLDDYTTNKVIEFLNK